MTKIKVNIPFGTEPNKNGRIYSKECVKKKICDAINEKRFPITHEMLAFDPSLNISLDDTLGFVEHSEYFETDNKIELECEIIDEKLLKLLENNFVNIVPNGTGDINTDTKEVENYTLKSFSITGKSAFKKD